MSKVTETRLADLLGAVTTVLTEQVVHRSKEITFDADGASVEGEEYYSCSPATLAVAVKLLKDNNITCDVDLENNTQELREALSKRQKRSLGSATDIARMEH